MSSRRDVDRRDMDRRGTHGHHDRDFDSRKHPSSSSRPSLNEYWIAGDGINRQVLQTEICKYLGAEATCRPGEYQGVPGYKIKALRPFTPDMLDDLRTASKAFSSENRAYMKRHDRELAYNDSQTYEQTNGSMDFERPSFPGRDSPAYTTAASYGGAVSSAPGYPSSSAGFSGASAFASHSGPIMGNPAYNSAGPEHGSYGHPPSSRDARDPRDAMMRDAPSYGNAYSNHSSGYHGSGPSYGDAYAGQRGDPRGDARMGYDNYGGSSFNGAPPRRQEPAHFDSMQGMSGPGAGYGNAVPSRNGMPAYNDQGYDPYSRGATVDPRYGRR